VDEPPPPPYSAATTRSPAAWQDDSEPPPPYSSMADSDQSRSLSLSGELGPPPPYFQDPDGRTTSDGAMGHLVCDGERCAQCADRRSVRATGAEDGAGTEWDADLVETKAREDAVGGALGFQTRQGWSSYRWR
jgi:hypothetical protein